LCVINYESLKIQFWKLVLQHNLIKLCPHDMLSFNVLKLHVTNCNGHHFIISGIVHMTSHSCPTNNMLKMIKHDIIVLQIPYRLQSCDQAHSTPHIVCKHFVLQLILESNTLEHIHNNFWTSIQGCYQYSHALNDGWKK
jgi:hypothetical protein